MSLKDEVGKVEDEVKQEATGFFAKTFTGKTLAISVGVAFVAGLLVHLI